MAKGRDRPAKEAKKPKADKNKKVKNQPLGGKGAPAATAAKK